MSCCRERGKMSESCSGLFGALLAIVGAIVAIAIAGGAYGAATKNNNQFATQQQQIADLNASVSELNETTIHLQQEVMDLETAISRLPMLSDNTTWTKLGTGLCSVLNLPPIPGEDPTYSLYQATYHGLSAIFLVVEGPLSDTSSYSQVNCNPDRGFFDDTWVSARTFIYTPEQLPFISCTDPDSIPQYDSITRGRGNYGTSTSGGSVFFETWFYPFNDGVDTYTFAANMTFPITYTYGAPSPPGGKKKKMRTISSPRRRRPDFRSRGVHKKKLH